MQRDLSLALWSAGFPQRDTGEMRVAFENVESPVSAGKETPASCAKPSFILPRLPQGLMAFPEFKDEP
jgi:hypothetical protein